ncbi:MAG: hypothetical protein PHI88_00160 [Candidatus Pacebacteria bacterium]|nr:hypothetical protein [Candidatus Paceibacterota bacterium]
MKIMFARGIVTSSPALMKGLSAFVRENPPILFVADHIRVSVSALIKIPAKEDIKKAIRAIGPTTSRNNKRSIDFGINWSAPKRANAKRKGIIRPIKIKKSEINTTFLFLGFLQKDQER